MSKVTPGDDFNIAALSALIDAAYADIKSRLLTEWSLGSLG
jgi:hypothetical protein